MFVFCLSRKLIMMYFLMLHHAYFMYIHDMFMHVHMILLLEIVGLNIGYNFSLVKTNCFYGLIKNII